MIRISSNHAVLSWVYKNYRSFPAVETYDTLMETDNRIRFEILAQKLDAIFDYTFQEGSKIKLPNINIIKIKYGIIIDQTDHTMKNIIQEYWGTKTKYKVKYQKSPFPTDNAFGKTLFMATIIIGAERKKIEKTQGVSLNIWVGGIMHIAVQNCYDLQYPTMHLSGYINAPTEFYFLDLIFFMEYLMNYTHKPIMY